MTTATESICQTCKGHVRLIDSVDNTWSHDSHMDHEVVLPQEVQISGRPLPLAKALELLGVATAHAVRTERRYGVGHTEARKARAEADALVAYVVEIS